MGDAEPAKADEAPAKEPEGRGGRPVPLAPYASAPEPSKKKKKKKEAAEVAVHLRKLTKRFGPKTAVDDGHARPSTPAPSTASSAPTARARPRRSR